MAQFGISKRVAEGGTIAAAVVVAAGLAWYVQDASKKNTAPVTAQPAALLQSPVPDAPVTPAPADIAVVPQVPGFDTVRVTVDGQALVAGRAAPGAEVSLRLDGEETARATADASGAFVAMFAMPAAQAPRLLSLVQEGEVEITAPETVAIAPVIGGSAVASGVDGEPATAMAPQPPTTLLLDGSGARVLNAVQGPPGEVTVTTIAYTPDGGVQLSGSGAGGAVVRLYLDNAPVGEALVAADGSWFTTLRSIAPRLYTLRADQIDAGGKVSSRFETPFQRETREALAAVMKPGRSEGVPVPRSGQGVAPASAAPDATVPVTVTVQPGFTLWRIARESFGDGVLYVKVFEANKAQIRNPDMIYPGQVFTLPER